MNNSGNLFYDLYQLTMCQSYWRSQGDTSAVFELYVRDMPSGRGYLVLNGVRQALENINNFNFNKDDIEALTKLKQFDTKFLDYLANVNFTGTVRGMQDGDIIFPQEPVIQIEAPLIQGQLLETMLINSINYSSIVATKCSRIKHAAGQKDVIDFGARRAHSEESANILAYSGYMTGFQGTATVNAGLNFDIPLFGTMAHSYVMAFETEIDAFRNYATEFPDSCTFLVDTYDTIGGIKNAIEVGQELSLENHQLGAIRLDSGDYLTLAKNARSLLDAAGLHEVDIIASGGLDEYRIQKLETQNAPINKYGVGTRVAASEDSPILESVYKMVELNSRPVNKTSLGKESYPYKKNVYRKYSKTGKFAGDFIVSENGKSQFIGSENLLSVYIENGSTIKNHPNLRESRNHHLAQFDLLPDLYKSIKQPDTYPVSIHLK